MDSRAGEGAGLLRALGANAIGRDSTRAHRLEHNGRGSSRLVDVGTRRAVAGDDGVAGEVFALRDGGPGCKGGNPWRAFDGVLFDEVAHRVDFAPDVGHAWDQITVRGATHHLIAAIFVYRGDGGAGLAWKATIATGDALTHSGATRAMLLHYHHYRHFTTRHRMGAGDVGARVRDDGSPTAGRVRDVGTTGVQLGVDLLATAAGHRGGLGNRRARASSRLGAGAS